MKLIKYCTAANILFVITAFITGCSPSYPKETMLKDIVDMVKREYGYDVKARLIGKTLGVYFPLTQIIDYDRSMVESFSQKHNDIHLSIRRITTSSDAEVDFFVTIFTDQLNGYELSFTRSVEDIVRVLLNNISINDYAERMVMYYGYDPVQLAERSIRKLLEEIPERRSGVASYMVSDEKFNDSFLFRNLMESELKDELDYSIIAIKTKRISRDKTLVYVKVRETYTPKEGYEDYQFTFPSRTIHEFLFEMTLLKGFLPLITKTYSFRDKHYGQTILPPVPNEFIHHLDIEEWDDYFYLEEVTLPSFIIGQVTTRMTKKFQEADNPDAKRREDDYDFLQGPVNILTISGDYLTDKEHPHDLPFFQVSLLFKEGEKNVISKEVEELILRYFKRTLEKYRFTEYSRLDIRSSDGSPLISFDKKAIDDLQLDTETWKSFFKMRPTTNF
ncbi:hypothetical protein KDK77_06380 [bacterium]|nr:hypothetical protein [bacterium]